MPATPLPPEIEEFLSAPNAAVMATVDAHGRPNTAATWYLFENGRILLNFDEGRMRLEHIRRDPHVALTVLGDTWYRQVTIRGRVVAIENDEDFKDIDRLSTFYMGNPYSARDRGRVSAWIEIDRWHGWFGGKPWPH
jgi:PPOX class probable F420-dependent enzyme